MNTQSTPIVTDMKVIPVAGHDSMLLNIGGAHGAWFTRNIVVLPTAQATPASARPPAARLSIRRW
ncbi:Glucarate dehydratase-related protein [Raoultella terrigena]|uniref:Glucarate dehydratase-related protein n=1 Tax=Raoultella terrigena TaxID=577 RepID=A0A3P8K8J1_RAOTE|nr:Glucarate dehydratase-related protein [Raoultella terrigena]